MRKIKRRIKFAWQKLTRGFSDDELWNLDVTIAAFIAPRLRRFKETTHGFPADMTEEEWDRKLDEMIWAFETIRDDMWYELGPKEHARLQDALNVFGSYFQGLWD